MTAPTVIDLPHRLGRDEARRRLRARLGELPSYIPGGVAEVRTAWPEEYRMTLEVDALGQHVAGSLQVEESVVRVTLVLPPLLGFMAGAIASQIRERGGQLLLGEPTR